MVKSQFTEYFNKKTFFLFLPSHPHTLTNRLKRPVYRAFGGEGWCEGVRVKKLKLLSPGRKARCLCRTLIERITQIFLGYWTSIFVRSYRLLPFGQWVFDKYRVQLASVASS